MIAEHGERSLGEKLSALSAAQLCAGTCVVGRAVRHRSTDFPSISPRIIPHVHSTAGSSTTLESAVSASMNTSEARPHH
jgi:hypothetical protein